MSSFRVMSTKSRLKLGIVVVVIIHIGMFYGFWRVKAGQIGNKVYDMEIYKAASVAGVTFYEAVPSEECVKVLHEQAPRPGMPIVEVPVAPATTGETAKNSAEPKADTPKPDAAAKPKEIKLGPSLYFASAPRCKSIASAPAGAERLGADGFVGVELTIDKEGQVKYGDVSYSSGFTDLDEAAVKQVTENLQFTPCQKNGASVGCKQTIKYRWKIQ